MTTNTNYKTRVLLVDDEQDILDMLQYNFVREGYQVQTAHNGAEAVEAVKSFSPEIILMDVMMPVMDGVESCRKIREIPEGKAPHIIFLTSRSEEYTEVAAFECGGNDFINKPIKPRALLSRVASSLQRKTAGQDNSSTVVIKNMTIDRMKYVVTLDGENIVLPRKEFELLYYMASNPNRVIGREELLNNVWGLEVYVLARTVDVHVTKVRQKIGDSFIRTIKGVGYKFEV
jgi:two-component system alkaline phosphatase synthesis response regulator PhoP